MCSNPCINFSVSNYPLLYIIRSIYDFYNFYNSYNFYNFYNNSELGYCFNFYGRCFIRVYEDKRPVIKMETVSQFTIIIN